MGVCEKIPGPDGSGDANGNTNDACADVEFSFSLVEDPRMLFSKANGITIQINKAQVLIKNKFGGEMKEILKVQIDIAVC